MFFCAWDLALGSHGIFIRDDGLGHQNRNAESSTSLATQRLLVSPLLPGTELISFVSIRHLLRDIVSFDRQHMRLYGNLAYIFLWQAKLLLLVL